MKTLLVAINAKFEHEGLAVWYLKAASKRYQQDVSVQQHSINDSQQKIWASILGEQPEVVAFSCYIWNREIVQNLIADLKKAKPGIIIIVGGPEASYEGSDKDYKTNGADFVIKGEGEYPFNELLQCLSKNQNLDACRGFEQSTGCREESPAYISPFIPEYLERIRGRIAYIESSRGCPFQCSYCLSSETCGVIFYPVDEIKDDIESLVRAGAKVIKFVDRSFNVNIEHAIAIWNFIKRYSAQEVTFHFEVNPDRLTEEQLNILSEMPQGLMQIEAGIQSVNEQTLKAISRLMHVDRALKNLKRIKEAGNIHVHADLIAGLPYEDMNSFEKSFNTLYDARPHHLQLGFLKLLHGTRIRREASRHGYLYRDYPPYEVLSNHYVSSEDILVLKGVEDVVERFYNSGRFTLALDYLISHYASAYRFFEEMFLWEKERDLLYLPASALTLFQRLKEFALGKAIEQDHLNDLLALDYLCSLKTTALPEALFGANQGAGFESLDPRGFVDEQTVKGMGKSEIRKRFAVLRGIRPGKKSEDFFSFGNTIMIDVRQVDPVTNRARLTLI